jgi:hypothetical protein
MARRKAASKEPASNAGTRAGHFSPPPPPEAFGKGAAPLTGDEAVQTSALPLHDLFAQQARTMLDRTDLDEEQKQAVLVAMSCPCCGAGGMSFTAKLKRRS